MKKAIFLFSFEVLSMSTKCFWFFLLMNIMATQAFAIEWCRGAYDPETGKATLPCVYDSISGRTYWVELTRKEGLDFSVSDVSTEDKRLKSDVVQADILNIKFLEKKISSPEEKWMFLELNVIPSCGISSHFALTDSPSGASPGRIDVGVDGAFCPNPSWDTGQSIAGIVEVSPGSYEIYINGKLKKTVEVPSPDNQSP